jgi:hypothetical protein
MNQESEPCKGCDYLKTGKEVGAMPKDNSKGRYGGHGGFYCWHPEAIMEDGILALKHLDDLQVVIYEVCPSKKTSTPEPSMSQDEIEGWIEALEACKMQESYGDSRSCSLCLHLNHAGCHGCICETYFHHKPMKYTGCHCRNILYDKTGKFSFNNYKSEWRECCDDMIAWLEAMLKPCEGCVYYKYFEAGAAVDDFPHECHHTNNSFWQSSRHSRSIPNSLHYGKSQMEIHAYCPGKGTKSPELWGVKGAENWSCRDVYGKGNTDSGFNHPPCHTGWWATKNEALVAIEKSSHESNEFIPVRVTADGKELPAKLDEPKEPEQSCEKWGLQHPTWEWTCAQHPSQQNLFMDIEDGGIPFKTKEEAEQAITNHPGWKQHSQRHLFKIIKIKEGTMTEEKEKTITIGDIYNQHFSHETFETIRKAWPGDNRALTRTELYELLDKIAAHECWYERAEKLIGPRPEKKDLMPEMKLQHGNGNTERRFIDDRTLTFQCANTGYWTHAITECGNNRGTKWRDILLAEIFKHKLYNFAKAVIEAEKEYDEGHLNWHNWPVKYTNMVTSNARTELARTTAYDVFTALVAEAQEEAGTK